MSPRIVSLTQNEPHKPFRRVKRDAIRAASYDEGNRGAKQNQNNREGDIDNGVQPHVSVSISQGPALKLQSA
jgi:hypothetical protein